MEEVETCWDYGVPGVLASELARGLLVGVLEDAGIGLLDFLEDFPFYFLPVVFTGFLWEIRETAREQAKTPALYTGYGEIK